MGTILLINYTKAYNNLHAKYQVNCIDKTGSNVIHNYLPNRTHWKKILHTMADMKKLYMWLVLHDLIYAPIIFQLSNQLSFSFY